MEALFAQCVLGRRADRSGVLQFKRWLSYTLNSGRPNYLFLLSKISTSGGWRAVRDEGGHYCYAIAL